MLTPTVYRVSPTVPDLDARTLDEMFKDDDEEEEEQWQEKGKWK
jgi:hypothetical protein